MLTITGIIQYRTAKPSKTTKDAFKESEAKRLRERRAKARAEGKCGSCATRRPSPGFKTCEYCRNNQVQSEKRRARE